MTPQKIAVIGAGPMGLACAYELLKQGHAVDIYEADDRIGGMSASFDFNGMQLERYYHFICGPDQPMFDMLAELQLSDKLRWRETKMGFYYHGKLYKWGNPLYLLTFPGLGFLAKMRYAFHVLYAKSIRDWSALDKVTARRWLQRWLGEKTYTALWERLFYLKFFEYTEQISAAWIGTRIKRVALSRKNLFTEKLGYLEGGSETFLHALEQAIKALGGNIYLQQGVQSVITGNGAVTGLRVAGGEYAYQQVFSTIPLPYIPRLVPDLSAATRERIAAIGNVGVVCVLLKLKQPLSENFWLNINDPGMEIPGLIEFSNLNPLPHPVVYVPFYMPQTHPKYRETDAVFLQEVFAYLPRINPDFTQDWVLDTCVSRYEFAQTVCTTDFYAKLPPMQSEIKGFFMADTAYYYPEDRSISESIQVGKQLASIFPHRTL